MSLKHTVYTLGLLAATLSLQAQVLAPEDTSFTLSGTYRKTLKKYPDIQLVPEQPSVKVREARNLAYCDLNGRMLQADVFYPAQAAGKKVPAILLIHGGGWRSGNRAQMIPIAQQLAAHGYVAVTASYRLSTEAVYPAAVWDLKAAIRWMKLQAAVYPIDSTKIIVAGCSAGGQLAALLGVTANNPLFENKTCNENAGTGVAAIIDIDGTLSFVHPENGEGQDKPGHPSAATLWFGVARSQYPELWHQASPLDHTDSLTPPILFLNSSIDRMHAGRDEMIQRLNRYHIYSEVHTFPDAPHPFWFFQPWFTPMMDHILVFLERIFPSGK